MAKRWETMEAVTEYIFLGSKITVNSDCSHEIKRCMLLGRKIMTNLDSVLKSKDITLPAKVHLVKAMVLPLVMYKCEFSSNSLQPHGLQHTRLPCSSPTPGAIQTHVH